MTQDVPHPAFDALERQHGIPPDTYCGLSPEEMSRLVVACHSRPGRPGEPVGFWPVVSRDVRRDAIRTAFGPEADIERLDLLEQVFGGRVDRALRLDWMLPSEEFSRAVAMGLRRHFPELSDDAHRIIAGSYGYSHAK